MAKENAKFVYKVLKEGARGRDYEEAKAECNLKAKSLKTYREFFNPPRCYRTSLERHHAGKMTEDMPLYAVGRIVEETESGRLSD